MRLVWTDAGYAALVNADGSGTTAVTVAQIALGTGTRAAERGDTALVSEITRVETVSGQAVDEATIHVTLRDDSQSSYEATEIGLISADGILLARYAQTAPVLSKAAGSVALLSVDAVLTDVDATQITFESVALNNPPWSETVVGVVKRAGQAAAEALTDNALGMSPLRTAQSIAAWFGGATGPGHNGGVDADTVDNEHAADLHDASQLTGTAPRSALPGATTTEAGAVERATLTEARAGDDDVRYITARQLDDIITTALRSRELPVGSIYENKDNGTNPASLLGYGEWESIGEGRVTVGQGYNDGAYYRAGKTGGERRHRLTKSELPKFRLKNGIADDGDSDLFVYGTTNDGMPGSASAEVSSGADGTIDRQGYTSWIGGDKSHNNEQPYIIVYRWARTA